MASGKEVRRRIKSATNTKKIIRAMEMISVVKMQKTVANVLSSRGYRQAANSILQAVCGDINLAEHAFLSKRVGKRKLIILMTSDRGLCGGFNAKSIKKALEVAREAESAEFVAIGRKGRDFLKGMGFKIIAEFLKVDDKPTFKEIMPIVKVISDDFLTGKYDQVVLVYSHFESTLVQIPTALELLPFKAEADNKCPSQDQITFEPEKDQILDSLIPRILEIRVWQAILESIASEYSARMVAMKNANENAHELINDLTLTYNQTRQAGITREIAEISAGKMTLEG